MKSLLNYSKIAISTLITASIFTACSSSDDEAIYYTQYQANTANIKSAGEAVDLGLPSGTKWANKNVGAASANDNGILFVWGDITGTANLPTSDSYSANPLSAKDYYEKYLGDEKTAYNYDTLNVAKITFGAELSELDKAYADSVIKIKAKEYADNPRRFDANLITLDGNQCLLIDLIDSTEVKYFEAKANNKYTDVTGNDGVTRKVFAGAKMENIGVDDLIGNAKYDAATANWGANWQMPTEAQLKELVEKCKWEFESTGYKVTGPNGNSIFLPAAGYRYGTKLVGNGNAGYYVAGNILGTYDFPSLEQQKKNSIGTLTATESTPGMLVYQYGDFDKSIKIVNLATTYALSIRPVLK